MTLSSATRFSRRAAPLLAAAALALATAQPAAAGHRRGGGWHHGGFHHGGRFHHHHFHSFVFFGTGFGYPYYPYYPYASYPAYPAYYPPPTYVSPTECYQPPVPRAPGVADLYTCSGQYVGPIAVP
jgi:hypothetical protein